MSVHGLRMCGWDGYCWRTFNLADAFITLASLYSSPLNSSAENRTRRLNIARIDDVRK
jgi:lipoprotein signal peptidase